MEEKLDKAIMRIDAMIAELNVRFDTMHGSLSGITKNLRTIRNDLWQICALIVASEILVVGAIIGFLVSR